MAGYNRKEKSYTLTAERMEYYHRHHNHTSYPRKLCPICSAQYGQEYMEIAADFFRKNGFEVMEVGDAHITISAPSKARKKYGMWITKETDELYQLLAGRIDPLPGSLPASPNELEPRDEPGLKIPNFSNEAPAEAFQNWLQKLQTESIVQNEIDLIERIQTKFNELFG